MPVERCLTVVRRFTPDRLITQQWPCLLCLQGVFQAAPRKREYIPSGDSGHKPLNGRIDKSRALSTRRFNNARRESETAVRAIVTPINVSVHQCVEDLCQQDRNRNRIIRSMIK